MVRLNKELNTAQVYGSGLALIIIFVLLYIFLEKRIFFYSANFLTVTLLIWPKPFRYFGIFWFGLGDVLGFIVSKIILILIYFVIVIPVGWIIRKKIRSNMQIQHFGKNSDSVFRTREYLFSVKDFSKPF